MSLIKSLTNPKSRQFRGLRDRTGKLLRNRVGGYKGFHHCEYYERDIHRERRINARSDFEMGAVEEPLNERFCTVTGEKLPVGGGTVVCAETGLNLVYDAGGRIVCSFFRK